MPEYNLRQMIEISEGWWKQEGSMITRLDQLAENRTASLLVDIEAAALASELADELESELAEFANQLANDEATLKQRLDQEAELRADMAAIGADRDRHARVDAAGLRPEDLSDEWKDGTRTAELSAQYEQLRTEHTALSRALDADRERLRTRQQELTRGRNYLETLRRRRSPNPADYPALVEWLRSAVETHEEG